MMWFRHIYRRLRHPLVLFGATAIVLLGTLTWLAWHILQQDRALVDQRIQERLGSAADLVATALQDKFSDVEEQLDGLAGTPDANLAEAFGLDKSKIDSEVLIAVVESGKLEAYPRASLRYYPVLPAPAETKADVFAPGEHDEFRRKDYASAATVYEKLVSSSDEATRTGALFRLGRVLRKANDPDSALDVYRQLAELGVGSVDGLPAELLARHARCVLLDKLNQDSERPNTWLHLISGTLARPHCLEHFLRPGDTVARLGGDEFAVLIHRVDDASGAIHVADRIQDVLSMNFSIDGHDVMVTASIGIAHSSTGYSSPEEILRDADIAMYRAKAEGKARYEIFDRDMHQSAVALLKLETELRRSVHRGDFLMNYQPIVSLGNTSRIVGFEGLVRWQHPERGIVAPANFIAIAEETGLIVPLGWWVLRESCRQTRRWQEQFPQDPPLWISVNMSGKLFMKSNMVDELLGILEETGLEPRDLRIEVTENVVMDHADLAIRNLMELRALGIQLSIDDFGTGYSSLSYLQRFHYDQLKIDRSFVSQLGSRGDSRAIVETILNLANSLGIGVVAEGIETADQVDHLRKMQCPHGQGFWFSRPLNAVAAEELMASSPTWENAHPSGPH